MPATAPHPPLHQQPRLLVRLFSEPQPVLDELRADYGPVVGLAFGPTRLAIVGGPAEVRSLFTRPVEDFRWNHKFNALAVVVGKQSMITSDGDDWARRRGAVQTAFSRRRLNGWIPMIIDQADAAVEALPTEGSHQVDLYRVGRGAILEIVVRAFFGASMADKAKAMGDLMQRPQDYLELPAWKQVPHPFPIGKRGRVRADRRAFDDMVRKAMAAIRDSPSHDPDDVLEVLVHDKSLSEQEILDQVNTLVGAGFDTTAASLAWMLWCCGLAPDVWEALRAEADVVLGAPGEERVFDHTTLNRLEVAGRVVKETLRLHPAGVVSPREAARDLDIAGYTLTKGTLILWSAHLAGRDPDIWDDPLQFRPDRFIDMTDDQRAAADAAWIPFGGGRRNCVGFALAQMELTLLIARLAQRLDLTPPTTRKPGPVGMVVNRPKGGVPFNVGRRN
ncbi:MAG: cytochrome P450 [Deltaproteobacteria bacterium]|nr:cytochrome P450 [Deltaproteobacteria bacterium]